MTDLRRTVASYFFRAQFGPPQPQRQAPQRLRYSGPTDTPAGRVAAAAAARQQARVAAEPAVDEFGISRAAATGAATAAPALSPLTRRGPDPRELATNRGEERARTPVHAKKEPGRNDPCPCGSGKKYKKCHGRGV